MNIVAVLLDFDGTIVLSEESRLKSINWVLEEYNVSIFQEEWNKKYKRDNTRAIFEDIAQKKGLDFDIEEMYKRAKYIRNQIIENEGLSVAKGFFEFIETIKNKGMKVLICSGGTREHIQFSMKCANIKGVEFIGREDYNREKPYPDCYEKGIEELGERPEKTLVIDDSYNGLKAGEKAGCNIIGINCRDEEGVEDLNILDIVKDFTQIDIDNL